MRLTTYRVLGFRRTSAGRIALQAEFLLPDGETMTDLGRLAKAAADQLEALQKRLAGPSPAVVGDAEDLPELNRLAEVLKRTDPAPAAPAQPAAS